MLPEVYIHVPCTTHTCWTLGSTLILGGCCLPPSLPPNTPHHPPPIHPQHTHRKQSAYRRVLSVLDAALADTCFRHVRQQLAAVLEPERSAVFDEILY